jgi:hypothetical protein
VKGTGSGSRKNRIRRDHEWRRSQPGGGGLVQPNRPLRHDGAGEAWLMEEVINGDDAHGAA